ncbi:unnamed protein product [marine sediment metagenome]|uniref:Uncharacterized protein n=1 Tax=marine sediment metagenome TaxID=412755 RepID=X1SHF7_9ZZZZ
MLKWLTESIAFTVDYEEVVNDVLAGMSGKNRVIKFLGSPTHTNMNVRAYRDAEQIVDVAVTLFTDYFTLLPVDIPLAEGQLFKAGFKMTAAGTTTRLLIVGYEETG